MGSTRQDEPFGGSSRPYVRWWWLSGPFNRDDITRQLRWVKENGFGGVELAWIYPHWLEEDADDRSRPAWLSPEWSELVAFAKSEADTLSLGCDFTFGSCWPFGGPDVTEDDASQTFTGLSPQRLQCSWGQESKRPQRIVNHLSSAALGRYAAGLREALQPALAGNKSALFCDSLELDTQGLWARELWDTFEKQFGYSLRPFLPQLDAHPDVRYDYRKFIGETIRREFYDAFTSLCHKEGTFSRVQCHGAPTDLVAAYAAADIPESEANLFLPPFSRIAASAAAWAGKPVVSAEAFTCIYGFPGWDESAEKYWQQEIPGDLRLLADALFANGVNQIVWHGMPYQPAGKSVEFYASVHVGPESPFAAELPAFNRYLETVSALLKRGIAHSRMGIYLPNEDALMRDRIPVEQRTPGANYEWEMRSATPPEEIRGFHPLWITYPFLAEARFVDGRICSKKLQVDAIYLDCEWLDGDSIRELLRLAEAGAAVILKRSPKRPGFREIPEYAELLARIMARPNVKEEITDCSPLLKGQDLPEYWAREIDRELLLFFAHPQTRQIRYPMQYGLSKFSEKAQRELLIDWNNHIVPLTLRFAPGQSLALMVDQNGEVRYLPLDDDLAGV